MTSNMGRPVKYVMPRRPRTIPLTDELWGVLKDIAGDGKRAEYIEEELRKIPEVAKCLQKRQ